MHGGHGGTDQQIILTQSSREGTEDGRMWRLVS
ncbi:hypothetical protein FHS01_004941 [Longimicrobium terrae]|uniref:Uncharacterized protein n=1 Tax=Longimicrobium terrae TaxID=1639882 RepID=A0A841H5F3_9BACT|nr:hypothetical protein [Longimicrobium terrae]MBB6073116.1 hypothetical protein [Longimicrobium terrae]